MYLDSDDSESVYMEARRSNVILRTSLSNGGNLYRVKDGKAYAVTGTKGYKWLERDVVEEAKIGEIRDRHVIFRACGSAKCY